MGAADLSVLTKEEIVELILEGADLNLLYRIDVFLERQMSSTHGELSLEKSNPEKRTALKNTLSWTENIREICKKRQYDLKIGSDLFNWNFRVEAEKLLPPEVYRKIAEAAKH